MSDLLNKFKVVEDLIGAEFKYGGYGDSYDCYNLCREVYKRFGKTLPSYEKLIDPKDIDLKISKESNKFVRVSNPEDLCLVLLKIHPKYVTHIGVVLEYPYFIHTLENKGVIIERLDLPSWNDKIVGYWVLNETHKDT